MSETRSGLLVEYSDSLKRYLDEHDDASLERARELGREAIADGVSVLEMAELHHAAMALVKPGDTGTEAEARRSNAAGTFLLESLWPYEATHQAFRESNVVLRLLNDKLQEEENRIAQVLHAEASQLLVSADLAIESLMRELPLEVHQNLSRLRSLLDRISDQIRSLAHELRPTILDDLGLLPALRLLAEEMSDRSGSAVTVEGDLENRPVPAVESVLFRAVQESLGTLLKTTHPTAVVVHVLKEQERIICTLRDGEADIDETVVSDGDSRGGIGLSGIRERLLTIGGTLQVISIPDRGTKFIITVPLEG